MQAMTQTATLLQQAIARSEAIRTRGGLVKDQGGGQLPLWDERLRGLPNSLARGALFNCRGKGTERQNRKQELIASLAGVRVHYTGEELRQDEEDVWLQVAHLARSHPLGDQVEVSAYQLLKELGWGTSSKDYARLRGCITRLAEGTAWVSFEGGRSGFNGRLIERVSWADAGTGKRERWNLKLDPTILRLFGSDDYTLLDWRQRLELRPLAKWLHSFYSTHREPLPLPTATLFRLSGSSSSHIRFFRRDLAAALDELVRVGFLREFRIDGPSDFVHLRRVIGPRLQA